MKAPFSYVVDRWLSQFGGLIDSIVGILTFGFWTPGFCLKLIRWAAQKRHRKTGYIR